MTKQDLIVRVRGAYEALVQLSGPSAEEARVQAGLPAVWIWERLTVRQLGAMAVACRIRLLEAS